MVFNLIAMEWALFINYNIVSLDELTNRKSP